MAWNLLEQTNVPATTEEGKKVKISILLPHTGSMNMEVIERFWNPLKNEALSWCEKSAVLCRVPSLPLARNILSQAIIDSDADYALWIDSDHLYEKPDGEVGNPNEALYLLWRSLEETGESIVSALYRAKQKHGFNYAIWKKAPPEHLFEQGKKLIVEGLQADDDDKLMEGVKQASERDGYIHIDKWTGDWFEVDVAGLGMTLMKREVFERMAEINKLKNTDFFVWQKPDSQSEDFHFFSVARALGYKVWCFAKVKLLHHASVFLNSQGSIRVGQV